MSNYVFRSTALTLGLAFLAFGQTQQPSPNKVGIIHIQNAIISTKDGQRAAAELQAKFDPRRRELEKLNNEIEALRQQQQRGSNTMSDEAKQKLMRDIDIKTRTLNRQTEDAQADLEQEQQKLLQDLGGRLMDVINRYARENAFSLILDVSSPQTPVLYAANGIDITKDVIALYDQTSSPAEATGNGGAKPPAATSAPAKPAAPAPTAPKPGTAK